MTRKNVLKTVVALAAVAVLASCGNRQPAEGDQRFDPTMVGNPMETNANRSTIWDIFKDDESDITVRVNKYIWNASLEVLDFLPVQSVDPFSGVIVTGYGVPPGGGRAYRATVFVRDPALDARSLHVAMQTRGGGAVSAATVKAIEDAILTRARQLRIADGKL
ncbi:DUF3576 domain-containing protein [Shimia sp.]|uniref:DUF3576 domain-containing protein n=1 Tax=Shimia sp. TaxID=1954381 RepID=UPI0035652904